MIDETEDYDSSVVPIEIPDPTLYLMGTTIQQRGPSDLDGFTADPVDAPDALTAQFRLPITLGSMPPRTMEVDRLNFRLKASECDARFRLRLHTASAYFDFPFRLILHQDMSTTTAEFAPPNTIPT